MCRRLLGDVGELGAVLDARAAVPDGGLLGGLVDDGRARPPRPDAVAAPPRTFERVVPPWPTVATASDDCSTIVS